MNQPPLYEIPQDQMITLLATLTLSMLMSIEDQLPKHARAAREIRNTEEAVRRLAKLNAKPMDDRLVEAGVAGWNAALYEMQRKLVEEFGNGLDTSSAEGDREVLVDPT